MIDWLDRRSLLDAMPFAGLVGIEITSADRECVTATLPWSPECCTAGGVLHGGAVMALADTVGGLLAFLNLPEGATTATISSSTQFTRAVRKGKATATSSVLHRGHSTIVVETDVVDREGRLAARVTQTQAIVAR
jgi:1,4-dihydroxy-2-naphthoyl-CoA hydrolase